MPGTIADIWNLTPTLRGNAIESYLAKIEYASENGWYYVGAEMRGYFPLVEFQDGNTLVSLKTVNTNGRSWLSDMRSHIADLGTTGATVNGYPANMALDLRVQPGGSNAAQQLIDYGARNGVTVIISGFGN